VRVEAGLDRGHEIGLQRKDAATNRLVGDLAEPALDEVEPRTRGRREVQMEAGVLREPVLHVGVLVGRVVVEDQMDLEGLGNFAVDLP